MEITIKRIAKKATYTIGRLYVDGKYVCDTLEDKDRGLTDDMSLSDIKSKKVYGETAIPTGTYKLDMNTVSPKFKDRSWAKPYDGKIPRFVDVKGFDGVLIHPLNKSSETLGCVGVGKNTIVGMVTDSTNTFKMLMDNYLIPAKKRGESITITIE